MARKYLMPDYPAQKLVEKLHDFVVALGTDGGRPAWMKDDYGLLRGKKILDIGSGSKESARWDKFWGIRGFAPDLCRALALEEMGAHPVGLDIWPNKGEPFEWHIADVTVRGSLKFLETGSFDVVNCTDVFGSKPSPTLSYLLYRRASGDGRSAQAILADSEGDRIPLFWDHAGKEVKAEIKRAIDAEVRPHVFGEAARILKEGSFFFLEHDGETRKFRKECGQLVEK
jgi:hypothetical protein